VNINNSQQGPFRVEHIFDPAPLHDALKQAGYTEPALAETVKVDQAGKPLDISVALRQTAAPTPFNTLVRLFVLAQAVPEKDAARALAPMGLEPLLKAGLLKPGQGGIQAEAALIPYGEIPLVRDF
jgi:hypothetical protein